MELRRLGRSQFCINNGLPFRHPLPWRWLEVLLDVAELVLRSYLDSMGPIRTMQSKESLSRRGRSPTPRYKQPPTETLRNK